MLLLGRTRATAMTNPLNSSTAEGLLERRFTRHIGIIRVRKNCAADLLTPAVVAEPCYPHAWVPIGRALLMVWMALVIHVVQQADRLPKIDIRAAKRCEMLHRVSNRVAMFSQAFRLDPIVKNRESAIGKCCHRRRYKSIGAVETD